MNPKITFEIVLRDILDFGSPIEFIYAKNKEIIKSDKELSGGQKSMVAFILTLSLQRIMKQPILLLDEVDAALDVYNSAAMANGMK